MKTTVDIPDEDLREVMRLTGAKTKREAIVQALRDFNRRKRVSRLVKHFGTFKSISTNAEIEADQVRTQEKRLRGTG
jgi:Bacterial antitoxin of type II TA system, VapB